MCGRLSSFVEIAVALHQVAGAFFYTTLLMVTQERCNSTAAGSQGKRQACISRFYLYNNLLLGITPLVFTFTLARLGDEKSRKITICVPLVGYLVSRSLLLWLILFQLPLEAMLATALLNGPVKKRQSQRQHLWEDHSLHLLNHPLKCIDGIISNAPKYTKDFAT